MVAAQGLLSEQALSTVRCTGTELCRWQIPATGWRISVLRAYAMDSLHPGVRPTWDIGQLSGTIVCLRPSRCGRIRDSEIFELPIPSWRRALPAFGNALLGDFREYCFLLTPTQHLGYCGRKKSCNHCRHVPCLPSRSHFNIVTQGQLPQARFE